MPETQPHKNVHIALLHARRNFGTVEKNAENKHFGNKYADLSSLFEATMAALNDEGILVYQPVLGDAVTPAVRTILSHPDSGTELQCDVPLLMAKQDMQALKSASTYARRIGFENLTGIAAADDDDAETERKGNIWGAALNDAWNDAVMDRLPANATPYQKAEAFANAICEDFKGKGDKALKNRWTKHKKMIEAMAERFPDLHGKVVDAYENRSLELQEAAQQTAAE